MPTLADIIAALRVDLNDPLADVFDDAQATRALRSALVDCNADLALTMALVDDGAGLTLLPQPSPLHEEMLLCLAAARLAGAIKLGHADAIRFSSGEKSADLTSAFKQWSEVEDSFTARYRERLHRLRPDLSSDVITLQSEARIYEVGSALDGEGAEGEES